MVGATEGARLSMTRILVVGATGMLGTDLMTGLADYDITGMGSSQLDITDAFAVDRTVKSFDIVINSAAFTAVDDAEREEEQAFALNAQGPRNLARACKLGGATLVQVSTDYVFDGAAAEPYPEDARANPQSVYGASKHAGEQAVLEECPDSSLIVRTSWLYGLHGQSFPRSILQAGKARETLDVVSDQRGQPTWTVDVVAMIRMLIEAGISKGTFHATNSGSTTWHGFASRLFELAGWDPSRVHQTMSADFPRPAPRPAWSVLGHTAWAQAGLRSPRPWGAALDDAWSAGLSAFASSEERV